MSQEEKKIIPQPQKFHMQKGADRHRGNPCPESELVTNRPVKGDIVVGRDDAPLANPIDVPSQPLESKAERGLSATQAGILIPHERKNPGKEASAKTSEAEGDTPKPKVEHIVYRGFSRPRPLTRKGYEYDLRTKGQSKKPVEPLTDSDRKLITPGTEVRRKKKDTDTSREWYTEPNPITTGTVVGTEKIGDTEYFVIEFGGPGNSGYISRVPIDSRFIDGFEVIPPNDN